MDKDFEKQINYANIPAWHAAGRKGKGVTILCDDVSGSHAERVAGVVETIAPEAMVLVGNIGIVANNNGVKRATVNCRTTGELMEFEDFVRRYNILIINNSKDGGDHDKDSAKAVWLREMRDKHNLILIGAAGNGAGMPINNSFFGAGIMVTGCRLDGDKPVWGYYAKDDDLDFSAFTAGQAGTSFASPFLAGMTALLLGQYPDWTQQQVYAYYQANVEDLGAAGKDNTYGWGLAVMGSPEDEPQKEEPMKLTDFEDVKAGNYYEPAIAHCVKMGYMRGVDEAHFTPAEPLTREQLAQVLYNLDNMEDER